MSLARLLLQGDKSLASGPVLVPGAVLSVVFVAAAALPLSPGQLAQLEALNRELGKLCASNPPRQALAVCRLHAKLIGDL